MPISFILKENNMKNNTKSKAVLLAIISLVSNANSMHHKMSIPDVEINKKNILLLPMPDKYPADLFLNIQTPTVIYRQEIDSSGLYEIAREFEQTELIQKLQNDLSEAHKTIKMLQSVCSKIIDRQDNTDYARMQTAINDYRWRIEKKEEENTKKDIITTKQQDEIARLKNENSYLRRLSQRK